MCNFPVFENLLASTWVAIKYYQGDIFQFMPIIYSGIGSQNIPAATAASPDNLLEMHNSSASSLHMKSKSGSEAQ